MADPGDSSSIGFIGLGKMGAPMARRLVAAGMSVRAFDVDVSARQAAADYGAIPAASPADAVAGSGVIILMLPNSAIVSGVLRDAELFHALEPGSIVVDMSSSEPSVTRELASELSDARIAMMDAPVSGGVAGANNGSLAIMVGGSEADLQRVLPILTVLGRPVRAGDIGAGHAIKALNNLLSATHLWATSEAMLAGIGFGLDPDVMLSIFNSSSGRSGSTENKWPNFILPGTYNSGFGLALMLKDMKIAVQLTEQSGAEFAMGMRAIELWQEAADGLPNGADHTEVARWLAKNATS